MPPSTWLQYEILMQHDGQMSTYPYSSLQWPCAICVDLGRYACLLPNDFVLIFVLPVCARITAFFGDLKPPIVLI